MRRLKNIWVLAAVFVCQMAFAGQGTAPDIAGAAGVSGNTLTGRAMLKVCPANLESSCTHSVEVGGKTFRFEGANSEVQQELKSFVEAEQEPAFTREMPITVEGFFVQKSGMWPDTTSMIDVLEITSVKKIQPPASRQKKFALKK